MKEKRWVDDDERWQEWTAETRELLTIAFKMWDAYEVGGAGTPATIDTHRLRKDTLLPAMRKHGEQLRSLATLLEKSAGSAQATRPPS